MPTKQSGEGGSYRAHIPMHLAEALGEKIKQSSPSLTIRDAIIQACLNYLAPPSPTHPPQKNLETERVERKAKEQLPPSIPNESLFSDFDDFLDT